MYDKHEMLKNKNWAIVGITDDKERFGYKIPVLMKEFSYNVYGVNPKYDEIEGIKVYENLSKIEGKVDAIDMIVSPKFAKNYLNEAKELGIKNVFFQPGSYDDETLKLADDLGFNVVVDCVYATLKEEDGK